MSLKQEFQADLSQTFLDVDEFGEAMTFRITETGAEKEFAAPVIWDTESLKVRTIVQQQGVFLGTVLCFIATDWFAVEPKPEQVIYQLTRDGRLADRRRGRNRDLLPTLSGQTDRLNDVGVIRALNPLLPHLRIFRITTL
jgi:hypothetical protein